MTSTGGVGSYHPQRLASRVSSAGEPKKSLSLRALSLERRGFRKVFVWRRNYLSNMAPTSALCALCVQSQCVITMSLHSYIVITELLSEP